MSLDDNREILRRSYAMFSRGEIDVADELIAADCVDHNPMPGQGPGREGLKQAAAMIAAAFPHEITELRLLAEGDMVAGSWRMEGRHVAEFMGIPPTGRPVSMTGHDMVRIRDGRIVEWWHQEDVAGLMQQLGVLPEVSHA